MQVQDLLIPDEDLSDNSTEKGKGRVRSGAASLETRYFVIEFIHDTVCPFCYIGMKNLFRAIDIYKQRHPDAVFEITATPSILATTAKASAYFKTHYYSAYRGLPESRFELWSRLGQEAGIRFSWNGRTGQTRNSHKLLRFALQERPTLQRSTALTMYGPGKVPPPYPPYSFRAPDVPVSRPQPRGPDLQMRLLDAICRRYHEQDEDLSDPQMLLNTAMSVTGFPRVELQAVLDSEEWDRTIDKLSEEVKNRLAVQSRLPGPIVAVPTMVVNKRWVYGGFQSVDLLVNQFELLRQNMEPEQEYTLSTLVIDAGSADKAARDQAIARGAARRDGQPPSLNTAQTPLYPHHLLDENPVANGRNETRK
ncbi:thioredoxin-like protein [Poronia punctata]|nr:thioredoxin-like protein [Poronia punctata]